MDWKAAFTGLLLLSAAAHAAAPLPSKPSLVLTSKENGLEPQGEFVCDGKIHGYLRLPGPAAGSHLLEGIWKAPDGRVVQHGRIPIDFPPPGRSTAYLWLAFPERPAFGRLDLEKENERRSYNGPWQLEVRWDEKFLLHSTFTVHCQ